MEPKDYVKKYIAENPAPARGLILDIDQKPPILYGVPGTVHVVYYTDNLSGFPTQTQEDLAGWLVKLSKELNRMYERIFVTHLEQKREAPR